MDDLSAQVLAVAVIVGKLLFVFETNIDYFRLHADKQRDSGGIQSNWERGE